MDQYGYFSKEGYHITRRDTPRHWYNYLFNDEYITFLSQVGYGQGFAQDDMGRRLPTVDDRNIYIVENERVWSALGLPVHKNVQAYECLHAVGYTDITLKKNELTSECRFFVPNDGKREYWIVTLYNHARTARTFKIIPFCDTTIDCRYTPQGYETDYADFMTEKNLAYATGFKPFESDTTERRFAYLVASETVTGFDTRRSAFIGEYGNKQQPRALIEHAGCTNSDCIAEKTCLALENTITLLPGERKSIYYTIGVENSLQAIACLSPAEIDYQFDKMKEKYQTLLGGVSIKTPWQDLNCLFNDWLKYQTLMGSRWARVRHNGFRDITSDTECLACINAPLAAERLCRILSYQYANGYAPRTFLDGKIQDKNFADNTVWPIFTAYAVVKELGSTDFLLKDVPFNDGSSASVYEHLKRSLQFLWNFTGHYGLIRIWGGDWNDCMNKAGLQGKGVSVWLSIAFVRAAKMFWQMANWMGNAADAAAATHYAEEMERRVTRYGWEDDRFLYAISDDKHAIGSKGNEEGSLFALPQLWCVMADFDKTYQEAAMKTLEAQLNTDLGLLVSKPPYTHQIPYIGSMTRKYPGLHENGGVYLHAAAWKLAVDSMLLRPDKVEEGLQKMLPAHHEYAEKCGEPYSMFNSYLTDQTGYRVGKPGQSWRTASGQWMMYALVRWVYGFQPEFGGAKIAPCLPPSWTECSLTKTFRGCKYHILYRQRGEHPSSEVERISVNGTDVSKDLPIKPMDGKTLTIEVFLK